MGGLVLVTGATGNVGQPLVEALLGTAADVRVAARSPGRVRGAWSREVPAVRFDFLDPSTYANAFAGVRRLFLVRPPELGRVRKEILPALVAAEAAGVEHVVFLSLQGAESKPVTPHRTIERHLEGSGMAWTFLRPSFFMQNLGGPHREDIRDRGEILVPAGRGRTNFIDTRDIAEVARLALTEPGRENRAYELTGPEALTYAEVAERFSAVLGRPIRYPAPSALRFIRHMRGRGFPLPFVIVMTAIYTSARLGLAARTTGEMTCLLGRPPRDITSYIQDHRGLWER